MLTVVIPTHDDEDGLAHMLPGLVRHAVTGAITEAIVYDAGSSDDTRRVADMAGCHWFSAADTEPGAIIGSARAPWLLLLEPGARPVGDWIDAVEAHVTMPEAGAARFRVAVEPAAGFWRRLIGPPSPSSPLGRGLVISKRQAAERVAAFGSLEALPRGAPVRILPAAIIPAKRSRQSG